MLTVIDEFTRESLAIKTARRRRAENVLETMADLFEAHGPPTLITPGSPPPPRENRFCDGFNGRMRNGPLNGELLYSQG